MKHGSTVFLKIAIFLIGLPILLACIFWVPGLAKMITVQSPEYSFLQYPFLVGVYGSALVFYFALFQALTLLSLIDRNNAFSADSVVALKRIKISAVIISILYVAQLPLLLVMAEGDDAPGLIVLGLVIIFASLVIAVFAAVLQRLLNDAYILKSEVDLTV